ncbi:MAG: hypothetical protein WBO10_01930 [Pyrinomonadaceae bacterium]
MKTRLLHDPEYVEQKDDKAYMIKYWNQQGEIEGMLVKASSTRAAVTRFEKIKKTTNWFSANPA